jgi:hypothetical protein
MDAGRYGCNKGPVTFQESVVRVRPIKPYLSVGSEHACSACRKGRWEKNGARAVGEGGPVDEYSFEVLALASDSFCCPITVDWNAHAG